MNTYEPALRPAPAGIEAGVTVLRRASLERESDGRFEQRVRQVQELLALDLQEIELALEQALARGIQPATQAARYLVRLGGKRARPAAMLLSSGCFGPIPASVRDLAVVAELVHSATLMHDDVVDEATERRGALAARCIWGNAMSVLAGDLLLVHALERTSRHGSEVMADLLSTLRQLVEGEILQVRARSERDLSEETYWQVVRCKTASLFGWATRTGARMAGASPEDQERMASFGEQLGVAFQLLDDVLDYEGQGTGKSLLADLREGKLTLPLLIAMQRQPELGAEVERLRSGEQVDILALSRAVVESGACDVVRARAAEATARALELLEPLPPAPARIVLEQMACELASRAA